VTARPVLIVPVEIIEWRILLIRGQKVMLDRDLAQLYQVTTGALNQAVQRNRERFPADFMFQLNTKEFENWKSQIVISNPAARMARKRPYAFTEQGVAMLSSVLKSQRAALVNVAVIRAAAADPRHPQGPRGPPRRDGEKIRSEVGCWGSMERKTGLR
jgi:hypothetical protein